MKDIALLILRIGVGISFIIHGYPKILGGESTWIWLGTAAGLTVIPIFWGLCAALSECVGGFLILIGLKTRIAAFFSSLTMLGAIYYHLSNNESALHPFELFSVCICIALIGGGKYSLDFLIKLVRNN